VTVTTGLDGFGITATTSPYLLPPHGLIPNEG